MKTSEDMKQKIYDALKDYVEENFDELSDAYEELDKNNLVESFLDAVGVSKNYNLIDEIIYHIDGKNFGSVTVRDNADDGSLEFVFGNDRLVLYAEIVHDRLYISRR